MKQPKWQKELKTVIEMSLLIVAQHPKDADRDSLTKVIMKQAKQQRDEMVEKVRKAMPLFIAREHQPLTEKDKGWNAYRLRLEENLDQVIQLLKEKE